MLNKNLELKKNNYELNQELLYYFLENLMSSDSKAMGTLLNIKRDIEAFLLFLYHNNDSEINTKNIINYLEYIEELYKESSYISKASSLRQFINWLNLENNPFWKLKISINYEDFKFYTFEEIFPEPEEKFDCDNLIVRTLYEPYLSIDELTKLRVSDFNQASGKLNIRGKDIKISDTLSYALKFYLKNKHSSIVQDSISLNDPLFLNSESKPLKSLDILSILKERNLKNIYLKRSRIIHLLNESKSISEIEDILAIKLSNFYQPFVKEKDYRLLSAYNKFHPRA
jgi:site-specific recombinase XerD